MAARTRTPVEFRLPSAQFIISRGPGCLVASSQRPHVVSPFDLQANSSVVALSPAAEKAEDLSNRSEQRGAVAVVLSAGAGGARAAETAIHGTIAVPLSLAAEKTEGSCWFGRSRVLFLSPLSDLHFTALRVDPLQ